MNMLDLLVLVVVGLWIYSQLFEAESMRQIKEHLDDIELHYSSGVDHKNSKPASS